MDEIKKNKYKNNNYNKTNSNKKNKENKSETIISYSIGNINKECNVHFGVFKDLKNYFCIHENALLKENKNIFDEISKNHSEKKN